MCRQGLLYESGTYYKDSLDMFAGSGIATAAILCNDGTVNTCQSYDHARVTADFAAMGVSLEYILKLNVEGGEKYLANLTEAVDKLIVDDIDMVVVHDFKTLCMDFVAAAKAVDWTPRALYLNLCGQDTAAMAELGTDVRDASC